MFHNSHNLHLHLLSFLLLMVPATAVDDEEDLVAPNEELCASWAVCSLSTHHKGGRTMMMMLLQPPLVFSHCVLFDKLHPHGLILLLLHTSPLYRRHDYVTPAVTSSVLLW